jgi:hypothetical protein
MELSDELYAQQPSQGPRGGVVKGSRSCSNVLHLNVETTRGRITRSLNTSDDAKAIERAKPFVAKAVDDGRIRLNVSVRLGDGHAVGTGQRWLAVW